MQIAYLYREVHGRSSFRPPGTLSGNAQTPLRPEKQREREQRLYEAACIKGKLHPDTENVWDVFSDSGANLSVGAARS